jgi:hypothetical protein
VHSGIYGNDSVSLFLVELEQLNYPTQPTPTIITIKASKKQ